MTTIVVPTDFSEAAKNATRYAIELAKQIGASNIVLYHSYEYLNVPDPLMGYENAIITDKPQGDQSLSALKEELQPIAANLHIEAYHSGETIETGLDHICSTVSADLIVMGMKGGSKLKEVLIGSNTIRIARHVQLPVIIVPGGFSFTKVEEVALAWDFRQVNLSVPVQPIKTLLDRTLAKLFVLNIMADKNEATSHPDNSVIENLLPGYNPEYHFVTNPDFAEAMNEFANRKKVDLIITFPKKHGWFGQLFNQAHTKQLAFHTHVPLMIVHD